MSWKKIAGILSLVVLITGLPVGVFLVGKQTGFFSKASPEETPKEIKITNISDNSFSVSWITDKTTSGFVVYGETEKLGLTASDDRDQTGQTPRNTHHATVKDLNPSTLYYFKIGSGASSYDDNGRNFSITTAPTTQDPPAIADPAYGKVLNSQGLPVADALVYITVTGGTPLSSYTRSDGNWLITLNNARRADLSTYITYKSSGDTVDLYVQAATLGVARATADTNNVRPVPNIKLGGTYSFNTQGAVAQVTPTVVQTGSSDFSLKNIPQASESATPLSLLVPQKNAAVTGNQPTFSGTGKPGEIITITIHSTQNITAQVTVGSDGKWNYTPIQPLSSGAHTVTIASAGQSDSTSFSVIGATPASTEKPTKAATSSATTPVAGANYLLMVLVAGGLGILVLGIRLALE